MKQKVMEAMPIGEEELLVHGLCHKALTVGDQPVLLHQAMFVSHKGPSVLNMDMLSTSSRVERMCLRHESQALLKPGIVATLLLMVAAVPATLTVAHQDRTCSY